MPLHVEKKKTMEKHRIGMHTGSRVSEKKVVKNKSKNSDIYASLEACMLLLIQTFVFVSVSSDVHFGRTLKFKPSELLLPYVVL